MNRALAQTAEDLRACPDLEAFWKRSLTELERFGIPHIFFGAVASPLEVRPERLTSSVFWRSNYPASYFETFGPDTFLDNEETAVHCISHSDIIFWHHSDAREIPPEHQLRTEIERELGFNVGFTVPASHFSPAQYGGFGVSMPYLSADEFPRYWRNSRRRILGLLGLIDAGLRQQHMGGLIGLSAREADVLTWLACGLRPDEIAERLGIGYRTVDKYINRARHKLRATTRDQTVAKALIFNLIRI